MSEDERSQDGPTSEGSKPADPRETATSSPASTAEGAPVDEVSGDTPSGDGDDGDLADALLHAPIPDDDRPSRRWAYPKWAMVLVSVFVLYHASVLLVHNLPSKGLSRGLHTWFNKHLDMSTYMHATGNTQSWAMFAPNPHRSNIFMRVFVVDKDGEKWDVKHDIYGRRTYPYLFYDRVGKINRRIVDQKGYRRYYAAWVCREWERTHEGDAPEEIVFVKMWTRVPPPQKVFGYRDKATGLPGWLVGYDPMSLHLHQVEEESIRCASTRHAQLPNYLRRRYGLPEVPEGTFRGLHMRTWYDQKQTKERSQRARREQAQARPRGDR